MKRFPTTRMNGWGIAIIVLLVMFIAAGVLSLLGGFLLLLIGEYKLGLISLAIGVVTLLFFGCSAILIPNPGNKIAKFLALAPVVLLFAGVFVFFGGSVIYFFVWKPAADLEHYLQVRENPITVKAVVTDHESYDDDGDTDYRSYVTYTYNDVRYDKITYENKDEEEDLTPLGEEVDLQVSPKDPGQQISKLKNSGWGVVLMGIWLLSFGLAGAYVLVQRLRLSGKNGGTPDTETICHDIKVMILSRFFRPFLLLCGIGYGAAYWRYSVVFGKIPLIVAMISGVLWLYCMYTTVRDLRWAENGEYELRRDVLVDKEESSDSEGNSSYVLYFEGNGKKWKTGTKAKNYEQAQIGDVVTAAFLPGKKKPTVYYGRNGRGG